MQKALINLFILMHFNLENTFYININAFLNYRFDIIIFYICNSKIFSKWLFNSEI